MLNSSGKLCQAGSALLLCPTIRPLLSSPRQVMGIMYSDSPLTYRILVGYAFWRSVSFLPGPCVQPFYNFRVFGPYNIVAPTFHLPSLVPFISDTILLCSRLPVNSSRSSINLLAAFGQSPPCRGVPLRNGELRLSDAFKLEHMLDGRISDKYADANI